MRLTIRCITEPAPLSFKAFVFINFTCSSTSYAAFAIARDRALQRIARRYIFIGLKLLHLDARRLPGFLHASSASFKI